MPQLGKLISRSESRDAVHVAIAPVVAGERLMPGSHVGLDTDGTAVSWKKPIGVVDPFLMSAVPMGSKFWLCLYPNTVASLRHYWEHPSFQPVQENGNESVEYLKAICLVFEMDYFEVIRDPISDWRKTTDGDLPYEFWSHYQIVKGIVVPEDKRYVRCAC